MLLINVFIQAMNIQRNVFAFVVEKSYTIAKAEHVQHQEVKLCICLFEDVFLSYFFVLIKVCVFQQI